ncbi:hypothetical protein [Pseudoflavonifractor phocaeensis]|uniref:hypothetical protein n=1 Tax=Pseudoflavonifractor phocaeensis TaxID=1870988 RepID=UPI0019567679|nr:hypothetical protein [Pseudoflavonifractor phocaeensis]MBM6927485.1 hypothetical protein [Pseudoflavonifractor phocaeensis]
MNRYRKILKEVLAQEDQDRERKIEYLMPRLCGLVDDAPYIFALDNGVAALTALYILCTSHNINTVNHYQAIKERLVHLIDDLQDEMLDQFPSHRPMGEE